MPTEPNRSETPGQPIHQTQTGASVSETIVNQVMTAEDCDLHDIPPLYEAIDPDALTALFTRSSPEVHFEYAGYEIEITPDQTVLLTRND